MVIAAKYSFNKGEEAVKTKYPMLLAEIEQVIATTNNEDYRIKAIQPDKAWLQQNYDPQLLTQALQRKFNDLGWGNKQIESQYPTNYYTSAYQPHSVVEKAVRKLEFKKERLGVDVQLIYDEAEVYTGCAKMTIFKNFGIIDTGVEIVPIKQFADQMSTGVSFFEQFVWDLEARGVSNLDIPVLILGIDTVYPEQ